jgi:hypothetical protein
MKKIFFLGATFFCVFCADAQVSADTTEKGKVLVFKDARLDELAKKEAEFNRAYTLKTKGEKGFRLLVLRTNDRPLAMKVRAQLLQFFPEQKVYMSFQPPFIKLKFGNFAEKEEAEGYRKQIIRRNIVSSNVYLVPEQVEVKPEKLKQKEG